MKPWKQKGSALQPQPDSSSGQCQRRKERKEQAALARNLRAEQFCIPAEGQQRRERQQHTNHLPLGPVGGFSISLSLAPASLPGEQPQRQEQQEQRTKRC